MRRDALLMPVILLLAGGCEDGPKQMFSPLNDDLPVHGGETFTQSGDRSFSDTSGGDSTARAVFCDESEFTALVEEMMTKPIIPDQMVGGIPLWASDGSSLHADSLIGLPEEGKFCDAEASYSDAFVWGPQAELIVFFDSETRLLDAVMVRGGYLGALSGNVTIGDTTQKVVIRPRDRVIIGDRELDQYSTRADAPGRPNSWLNNENVTAIYGMIRQTFFDEGPLPAGYDCVAEQRCDLLYSLSDESALQNTYVDIEDSGIQLLFSPDGYVQFVYVEPVRVAPFELFGEVSFGEAATAADQANVAPSFTSGSMEGCSLDVGQMTWADFLERCIDNERTLARVNYDVHSQRDAVSVEFNGIDLEFRRRTSERGVFADGEAPHADDILQGLSFSRSLSATLSQFVPADLALRYKVRLEERLRAAVDQEGYAKAKAEVEGEPGGLPIMHPFMTYEVEVPMLDTVPQRIGELYYFDAEKGPTSWLPAVVKQIQRYYERLDEVERAAVDQRIMDPVFLIEPFVHGVLDAVTFGATGSPASFVGFYASDDRRWSVGYANFIHEGVPYRVTAQYSLNFGAITYMTVRSGYSEVDEVINGVNDMVRASYGMPTNPYYDLGIAMSGAELNPYRLTGDGIVVGEADRELGTLAVTLTTMTDQGYGTVDMIVPGTLIDDRAGYLRQIRGERYEFVPAHSVVLYGKESLLVFHVLEDGTIGRVEQRLFKGYQRLCDGLYLKFGDNVREEIEVWRTFYGDDAYQQCEIVFNYSTDGTVLDGVGSLTNRVSFETSAGRAKAVWMWQ